MCIYYKDVQELTYQNREHVFPAGLGGKIKLEKGVVSDQANAHFSSMELKLMRQSLIASDRMIFGPGDRGSLSPEKASKSLVVVGVETNGRAVLSYTSNRKPYNISQFYMSDHTIRISMQNKHTDISNERDQFLNALRKFEDVFVHLKSSNIKKGEMIIGYLDGKYYVATSGERPEKDSVQAAINLFLSKFSFDSITEFETRIQQDHLLAEDQETDRMYAKIAMNTLAFIRGADYSLNSAFDDIRNWIVNGEAEHDYLSLPNVVTIGGPEEKITRIFPPNSHWCIFVKYRSMLSAVVCLYNHYHRQFAFGKIDETEPGFPFGFICDWKNKREYTLEEYINEFAKNHFRRNML